MEESTLISRLLKLRKDRAASDGPLVSIVVTNRDGAGHLRTLLDGLDTRTRYRSFELVLVDNGSVDGSLDVFQQWQGKKVLVANGQNESFSRANNQGVRAATGELVLLANNDIDPIHPDWLGYMVQSLTKGVSAVGAMLIYAKREVGVHPPAHSDYTIQHRGVAFELSDNGVRARNLDIGGDPLEVDYPGVRSVPAVTAACLLARRSDLLEYQFDERYWYGTEDWDLCLRLGNFGDIVLDERAVLFHHEYGTQDKHLDDSWLRRRRENKIKFNQVWGPTLTRQLRSELVGAPSRTFFRVPKPPILNLVSDPRNEVEQKLSNHIRRQATESGWDIRDRQDPEGDVAIAVTPPKGVRWFSRRDTSVALVLDKVGDWARSGALDAAKHVVVPTTTERARVGAVWGRGIAHTYEGLTDAPPDLFDRLMTLLEPKTDSIRIGVATCAPDWEKAQFWGDTHLARALMRAFRRRGHEAVELIKSDWHNRSAVSCDVVLHLRGLTRRRVHPGQWNILWIISHPDRLEPDEYDDYDVITSASRSHAEQLTLELGRKVHFVPQATDSDTFRPGLRDVRYQTSVLYVGNARWPNRRAPRWMMRKGRQFDLYGKNWHDFPENRFLRDEYIANVDLPSAYRSASVVVADHHGSMRTGGFIANRLYDVLASGGVVLSDHVAGLEELFGEMIPTYSDASELETQLRVLLDDPSLRRRIAKEGRRIVEAEHTLDHRAHRFLELLDEF